MKASCTNYSSNKMTKKTKQKKTPDIKSPHHLFILKSDSREQLIHSPRTTRDFPLLLLTTTQHFI